MVFLTRRLLIIAWETTMDTTSHDTPRKRRKLQAEEQLNLYKMCEQQNARIGELLRRHGLFSSDLQRIRSTVEEGALNALKECKPGRKTKKAVSKDEYDALQRELQEKEKALAEMTVLFTVLKKKVNGE
jgi:transposase-like protein